MSYALTKAPSGATIEVSGTIVGNVGIPHPVTITTWPGGPAGSPAVLRGIASGPVVTADPGVTGVTLNDLTIENGTVGVLNSEGTLTLTDSTVTGNANGGEPYAGIYNYADSTTTVVDSTVTKNSGDGDVGAGIYNSGTMTIIASTVSGNTGGGIEGNGGTATLGATIVADNTGANCSGYDSASLYSAGYNLTNDTNGSACALHRRDRPREQEPTPRTPRRQRRPDANPTARRHKPGR